MSPFQLLCHIPLANLTLNTESFKSFFFLLLRLGGAKNQKNRLKFWKNRPVRFQFYKSETEKTRKNRAKTKPNWFEPVFIQKTKPKPVGLNRFWFFFYIKNLISLFSFNKNQTKLKMITLNWDEWIFEKILQEFRIL